LRTFLLAAVLGGLLVPPAAAQAATTTVTFGGATRQLTDGQAGAAAVTYTPRTRAVRIAITMVAPCPGSTDSSRFTYLRELKGRAGRDGSFALAADGTDPGTTSRTIVTGRVRGTRVTGTFTYDVSTSDGLRCSSGSVAWSASTKSFAGFSVEAPLVLDATRASSLVFRIGRFQMLCDGGEVTNMRPVSLAPITPSSSSAARGSGTVTLTLDSGTTLTFDWTVSARLSRSGVATVTYALTNGRNGLGTRTGCYAGPLTVKLS
jgi:hypothetical protein